MHLAVDTLGIGGAGHASQCSEPGTGGGACRRSAGYHGPNYDAGLCRLGLYRPGTGAGRGGPGHRIARRQIAAGQASHLLPMRWDVERSFAWAARFRCLSRNYERLASTLEGIHYLVFA
ncbi:transposase [Hymenobacter sp. HD11105]